jgi:ABC-type polysaccharide/polyol phosphate export permease
VSASSASSLWVVRTPTGARTMKRVDGRMVPAETAWVGERWALLRLFVANDFRARYRAQALGVIWSLLQPLVMMFILSRVFAHAGGLQEPNFPIFLLIGLLVWQWISNALNAATLSFVVNADMVKRTVFPRALLPLSSVLSYGLNAAVESLVLVMLIPFFPGAFKLSPALIALPGLILCLIVILSGAALIVSVLNVIYRDVAYLVSTGLIILYWLTPVIYPPRWLPANWRELLALNPLGGVITGMRGVLLEGVAPTAIEWARLGGGCLAVGLLGLVVFKHFEREMLDHV